MIDAHSTVIISHAPDLDYRHDYVALPRSYGTPRWKNRADVQAITATVFANLSSLNERTHFADRARERRLTLLV